MKITWLRFAGEHLEDIYNSLEKLSPKVAANLYNDILDEVEKLSGFPKMASQEPLLEEEPEMFRSLIVRRRYKVIYFVEDETIKIVDVWDCRRDPDSLKHSVKK